MKIGSGLSGALSMLVLIMGLAGPAAAAEWRVDQDASEIGFSGIHAGAVFKGQFQTWQARIDFDPAQPETCKVEAVVDTASAHTGTLLYDGTLPNGEWFDVAHFPQARFVADRATKLADGQYRLDGQLTIKDRTVPVSLPFMLTLDGDMATVGGTVMLDRTLLDLGLKSDPGAAWVSRGIAVTVNLRAMRQP